MAPPLPWHDSNLRLRSTLGVGTACEHEQRDDSELFAQIISFGRLSFNTNIVVFAACADGTDVCDDPHMKGLRGQRID